MLYKKIDSLSLKLEYACPFCLSAKFAESVTLNDHVGSCQAARIILTADELADIPNLQIGEGMTMADYYTEEEAYYKNMIRFATSNSLAELSSATTENILLAIIDKLKATSHPTKNIVQAAWRIMATFFTLDDDAMERYLQIIYGQEDEDSEDEERKVWPAPAPAPAVAAAETETKTITILNDSVPSSTPCTHDNGP
jgi:hypothetical protein